MSRDFLIKGKVVRRWKRTCKFPIDKKGNVCNRFFWGGVRGRTCEIHYRTDGKGGRAAPLSFNTKTKQVTNRKKYVNRARKTTLV